MIVLALSVALMEKSWVSLAFKSIQLWAWLAQEELTRMKLRLRVLTCSLTVCHVRKTRIETPISACRT